MLTDGRIFARILSTPKKGWTEFPIEQVPKQPGQNGLVRFKLSDRWHRGVHLERSNYLIPFIDRTGITHATSVARWRCDPAQLLATTISTISKRLRNICRPYQKRPTPDQLFRVAAVYAITNDDSFYRRCLEMISRSLTVPLRKFVYRYEKRKMGTTNRFLYDHVRFASKWFQSRVDKCPLREIPKRSENHRHSETPIEEVSEGRRFAVCVSAWADIFRDVRPATETHLSPAPRGKGWWICRGNLDYKTRNR